MTSAQKIVEELKKRSMTVSFAESCTGGLLAKMITDVSGSSSVFECGIVSYSNRIKYTAVSEQTVIEMAQGVKKLSASDIAAAVSGIAGPESDGSGMPVGLIWICVIADGKTVTKKLTNSFETNVREQNRLSAAEAVFDTILSIFGSESK